MEVDFLPEAEVGAGGEHFDLLFPSRGSWEVVDSEIIYGRH